MKKTFLKKKIWLTTDKKKYCWVKVYRNRDLMRAAYKIECPNDKHHDNVDGIHHAYTKWSYEKKKRIVSNETGTVLLCKEKCGAGVVTHELLHAVLWGGMGKRSQYPIMIKNMKQEERMAHNHTFAVRQFYNWFFDKVKGKL